MSEWGLSFGGQHHRPAGGYQSKKAGMPKFGQTGGINTGQGPPPPGQGQGPPNPFMVTGMQQQPGIQPYDRNSSFVNSGFTAYA